MRNTRVTHSLVKTANDTHYFCDAEDLVRWLTVQKVRGQLPKGTEVNIKYYQLYKLFYIILSFLYS